MTVRVLMTADAVGGVWTYALDLARGLSAYGVETVLAVTGPSPNAEQTAAASAMDATLIDTGLPLDWLVATPEEIGRAGAAIRQLATDHAVDLIHLNTPALAAGARTGIPLVVATHSCLASWWEATETGPLPTDFAWRTDLHAAGLRAATRTIAPTAAFADVTHRLYGVRPAAVHNGRAALSATFAPMVDEALTVGRLWDKGKSVAVLDRAAALISAPLYAAGATSGPNGDAIALAHAHPLGHLSDAQLGNRLAARPVFVTAARYEPFGLAVLEAAASGSALVLSDVATFRELWDGCATFVHPDDAQGFANAITALIDDPGARIAQGDTAKARARRYTPEATAAATLAIYRTVLPAPRAAAA